MNFPITHSNNETIVAEHLAGYDLAPEGRPHHHKYNKARQAAITAEVSEITAGVEAMK